MTNLDLLAENLVRNLELNCWTLLKRNKPKSSRELNFKILTPNDFHVLDIKSKDEFGSYDFDVYIEYQHLDNSYKSLIKLEKYWDNYINEDHPNTVKYDPQKNIINMSWEVPGPSYFRRVPGRISGPATINYDIKNKEIISTKWALGPTDSKIFKEHQQWLIDNNVPDKIFKMSDEMLLLFKLQFM